MSGRSRAGWRRGALAAIVLAAFTGAGCGGPGAAQPQGRTAVNAAAGCGTVPVTLNAYVETGFPVPNALAAEFSKQYPNVTWSFRTDQFAVITQNAPRVLATDPPDLMRLPLIQNLVRDGLLLDLDPYWRAYGWDKWPRSELEQLFVAPGGRSLGTGSLYAMGLNYSMTGVFYNRTLAAQIGRASCRERV